MAIAPIIEIAMKSNNAYFATSINPTSDSVIIKEEEVNSKSLEKISTSNK